MRNFYLGIYITCLTLVTVQDFMGLEAWIAFLRRSWINVPPIVWVLVWIVSLAAIAVNRVFREIEAND